MASILLLSVLLAASSGSLADTAGRPDDGTPDEVYEEMIGPDYPEDKEDGGDGFAAGGGGGSAEASLSSVAEDATSDITADSTPTAVEDSGESLAEDASTALAEDASVSLGGGGGSSSLTGYSWPVQLYNWTIYSWAPTNNGFRFFGLYYKNELILYEYRVPWVKVNGNLRGLTPFNLVQGPDMWVYYSGMFLVKARFNLGNPNIDVTLVTRFYGDGTMEPWVLVDTHNTQTNIQVGQRFDFDLGETADDNQQYYNGLIWAAPGTETSILDSTYSANATGYQWRDFDSDASGNGYLFDQEAAVKPYSADDSKWYILRYCAGETAGDPVNYLDTQVVNQYMAGQPDPWMGEDGVNWYVSTYAATTLAYPGPWIKVKV